MLERYAMNLHLVSDVSTAASIPPGSAALVFDRLAVDPLHERGVDAFFIDDLLDWKTRAELEDAVSAVLDRLERAHAVGTAQIDGYPLLATARYQIRIGVTDLLRTAAAVRRLPGERALVPVADDSCSPGTMLGAAAATGTPLAAGRRAGGGGLAALPLALEMANRVTHAAQLLHRRKRVRVLAFPGGKVLPALLATEPRILRSLPLGVAGLPGLVGGGAARLAARGLPAVIVRPPSDARVEVGIDTPANLTGDAAIDEALRLLVTLELERAAREVTRTARAVARLDTSGYRAVIIPSTSGPVATVVREWARRSGLTCAVLQHGIYGFRDWDDGDRSADLVLAWGPAVREQLPAGMDVRVVGAPGIPDAARRAESEPRRILVLTTNAPVGSALGQHDFCGLFLDMLAPTLRLLRAAGYEITLRPHPIEDPARYRRMLEPLAEHVAVSHVKHLIDDVAAADLVIGSTTSATFEAAALHIPVALWLGGVPSDLRRRYLLPPLDGELPASFAGADDLASLAHSLAQRDGDALDEMRALSARLRDFATPFRQERLAEEIAALAS